MPYENQYMELCRQHPRILLEKNEYEVHIGKWSAYFGNKHPIVLEIGTGMGNYFSYMVEKHTDTNFIGLELRYKRLFTTAKKADEASQVCTPKSSLAPSAVMRKLGLRKTCHQTERYLILKCYGQEVREVFGENEISDTYIYFPDPFYNKLKHKKHQLLSKQFLGDIYFCTKSGGELHFKTDHKGYFEDTLKKIEELGLWSIKFVTHDYKNSELYNQETITEFEGLFRGEQEDFYYLILEKK